jgi:hypothetical protein
MKLLRPSAAHASRRGAALLLSILVLFVLIAIVAQISIGTMTDARVGRNDVGQTLITEAIDSAQYDIFELLKSDSEASSEEGGGDPMADAASGALGGEDAPADSPPADSRKDEWAIRQRTEINGIQVLIQVEAENAKYNILNMLSQDEEEAEEAYQRVVRIIDLYREETDLDISRRDADEMVGAMKRFMIDRHGSGFAEPNLLTFDEEQDTVFLPQSLRDFLVLEPFQEHYFRSFRDQYDNRVHSLDQFLTVWSSPAVLEDVEGGGSGGSAAGSAGADPKSSTGGAAAGGGADAADALGNGGDLSGALQDSGLGDSATASGASGGGTGGAPTGDTGGGGSSTGGTVLGYGVNINLAPAAVLKGLFDDREVRGRFWDDVIEYRNLEEEEEAGAEETEPIFDEFGEEVLERQAFESATELSEVRSWDDLDPETQARVSRMMETESSVFTIYITGRRNTSAEDSMGTALTAEERARQEEEAGGALVRTIRVVVWRRSTDDGVEILPIVPWEELDFTPFEIEDYPEEY